MKKYLQIVLLILCFDMYSKAQTGNLQFSLKKGTPANEVRVFVKNISGSQIQGNIGDGLINLCIGWPKSHTGNPVISSLVQLPNLRYSDPFAFGLNEVYDDNALGIHDSIYTWVANGSVGNSTLTVPANTEVEIATITFSGPRSVLDSIRLFSISGNNGLNIGTGQEYCYIAPGGSEESGYGVKPAFYGGDFIHLSGADNQTSYVGIHDVLTPVKNLLSFFAIKDNDNAKLNWAVTNDGSIDYYTIERSVDGGKNFSQIQKVNSYQNGKSENTYEIKDMNLSVLKINTIFYRIKLVDRSGNVTYTEVRSISLDSKKLFTSLYPNPAINSTKLVVDAPEAGKASLVVRDAAGKTVQQINTNFVKGFNQQQINVSMFAAGDYHVTILGGGINETIKLTKVN